MSIQPEEIKSVPSYKGSFIILLSTLVIGFILEIIVGGTGVKSLVFPYNSILLAELVILIPLAYRLFKHTFLIKWLSSIPAAIASIVAMTVIVLLMGFIPQETLQQNILLSKLGFGHLFHSWPYIIASFQLIIILGFTIVRRLFPINIRNLAFFLNHFGLWLVIASASLGAGDVTKLMMYGRINETTNIAIDEERNQYEMPFSITLHKFSIEEYTPMLVLVDNKTGKIIKTKKNNELVVEEGKEYQLKNWKIKVKRYIPYAKESNNEFSPSDSIGAVAAALLQLGNKENWVNAGNFLHNTQLLRIDSAFSLAITIPMPKKYKSDLTITDSTFTKNIAIEVNKPFSYKGWEIYQSGFDERKGKWSDVSIFELVRDPWLPVVFTGIYLLIGGAIMMFWLGTRKKENE